MKKKVFVFVRQDISALNKKMGIFLFKKPSDFFTPPGMNEWILA
jgi:hypothetical protein